MRVYEENNRLVIADGTLTLWLEPWGENSFRVRMTKEAQMDAHDWALTEEVKMCPLQVECKEVDTTDPWYKGEEFAKYHQTGKVYTVKNGKITAVISPEGWISYYNQKGELLTEEYWRNRNRINRYCVPLRIDARELKPIPGSTDYELTMRFEAFDDEKIFGMGQYQEKNLNKKRCNVRTGAQKQSGERAVYGLKQRLWIFLEQPGNRNSSFWCKQDRVVRKVHKKTGLLYYGRRYTV